MSDDPTMTVERSEEGNRGRFRLLVDGETLGEMTYSRATEDLVIVDHTETDERLRGQGGGKRLFDAMVAWARETETKVTATCPFATAMFERDESSRDVLL